MRWFLPTVFTCGLLERRLPDLDFLEEHDDYEEIYPITGIADEADTFPYGFFKWWGLEQIIRFFSNIEGANNEQNQRIESV